MQFTHSWMAFWNPNSRRISTRNGSNGWTAAFRRTVDITKNSPTLILTLINVAINFFVLLLLFFFFKKWQVCLTRDTKRGVTSGNFNFLTLFGALSTRSWTTLHACFCVSSRDGTVRMSEAWGQYFWINPCIFLKSLRYVTSDFSNEKPHNFNYDQFAKPIFEYVTCTEILFHSSKCKWVVLQKLSHFNCIKF